MADGDVEARGLSEQRGVKRGDGIDANPELAGAEVVEDGGHAAHVVGVGVGEDEEVEAAKAAGPEVGGDDLLADVEGGEGFGRAVLADGAAGVDQHGLADGVDGEDGVALADVEGGESRGYRG